MKEKKTNLRKIRESFNSINNIYRQWVESELQMQMASPASAPLPTRIPPPIVLIDQMDVYNNILQKLDTEDHLLKLQRILICYVTSLCEHGIPAQHNIDELMVTTLVRQNKFSALQQFLQYGVVSDSKPLACLLLSLGNMHPAASQLALDMLSRLSKFSIFVTN